MLAPQTYYSRREPVNTKTNRPVCRKRLRRIIEKQQIQRGAKMSLAQITVLYGHLEGNAGNFAREPSGHLAIPAGIFARHGLDVSWTHVQGTEERYRWLEDGRAQISLVVGRASLSHFLASKTTRLLGCSTSSR